MDPNSKRFSLVEKGSWCIICFKQIYDKNKTKQIKQTTMDIFLKRVKPPQEGPQVGPQEEYKEKALLSQEMRVPSTLLPLETFQWDAMGVEVREVDCPDPV